jgi:hypothetical protein
MRERQMIIDKSVRESDEIDWSRRKNGYHDNCCSTVLSMPATTGHMRAMKAGSMIVNGLPNGNKLIRWLTRL